MNPWEVQSLQDFTFICCPECVYRSQDAESFECHALDNHPDSKDFFKVHTIKPEFIEDPLATDTEFTPNLELNYVHDIKEDENSENQFDSVNVTDLSEHDEKNIQSHEDFLQNIDNEGDLSNTEEPKRAIKSKPGKKQLTNSRDQETPKINSDVSELHKECQICFKKFESWKAKNNHIDRDHEEIICGHCSKKLATRQKLIKHIQQQHQKVRCEECQRDYASSNVYKKHLATFHAQKSDKKFKCSLCDYKTFAQVYLAVRVMENRLCLSGKFYN